MSTFLWILNVTLIHKICRTNVCIFKMLYLAPLIPHEIKFTTKWVSPWCLHVLSKEVISMIDTLLSDTPGIFMLWVLRRDDIFDLWRTHGPYGNALLYCTVSIAMILEMLESCNKPLTYCILYNPLSITTCVSFVIALVNTHQIYPIPNKQNRHQHTRSNPTWIQSCSTLTVYHHIVLTQF